jgi:putative transposase
MPRIARVAPGGIVYHVLNRGNGRQTIFHKDDDSRAFLDLLAEVKRLVPMRVLGYCLMGNHWHMALWPYEDGDLSRFVGRLTTTHVRRYWLHYHQADGAGGHLYQGRFKNFPVETDAHLLTMLRYVEANPLRARLVARAEDWQWSSLRDWLDGDRRRLLDPWPVERPDDWIERVNAPLEERAVQHLRTSVARGRPFGQENWVEALCAALGLEFTLRNRGRPPKSRGTSTEPGLGGTEE